MLDVTDTRCPECMGDPCVCGQEVPQPDPVPQPEGQPEGQGQTTITITAGTKVRAERGRKYILINDTDGRTVADPDKGFQTNPHLAYACPSETCRDVQRGRNKGKILIVRITRGTEERIGSPYLPSCGFCNRTLTRYTDNERKP